MADEASRPGERIDTIVCGCGHSVPLPQGPMGVVCPWCAAHIEVGGASIRVSGHDSSEVQRVLTAAAAQEAQRQAARADAERRAARQFDSPWRSGSFYLLAVVLLIAVIVLVATVLPLWTLPLVIIGAVVLLAVVGAFQLRQDTKLSERNFLELMQLALRQLRLFGSHAPPPPP